jgi:Mn2+/Fe2+ NRAMP family transporter
MAALNPPVIPLKARSVMGDMRVKVTVTGVSWFVFRLWLGARIVRLGARVIGCNASVDLVKDEAK